MGKSKGKRPATDENGERTDSENETDSGPTPKLVKSTEIATTPETSLQINQHYVKDEFVDQFRVSWDKNIDFTVNSNVQILNKPFKVCAMPNFLESPSVIDQLIGDMMKVEWSRKQMDLYELFQSVDLASIDLPALQKFMDLLKTQVMPWMERLSGIELKRVSASCSMYNCGDYLLVHDDLVSDRQIAFVFYLSPWEAVNTWTDDMGGALELFDTDEVGYSNFPIVRRFNPKNNQLIFFKVGAKSFHQVAEVTNFDFPRLTINGWFHGDENSESSRVLPVNTSNEFMPPIDVECSLAEFINENYLLDAVKTNIQSQIEDESEISLSEFLLPRVYQQITTELEGLGKDAWSNTTPANDQNYQVLKISQLSGSLHKLTEFLRSKVFFQLLHEYTELDLAGVKSAEPKVTIEIQKWSKGCYTILNDSSSNVKNMLDIILFVNASENFGVINYVAQDTEDDVLLTVTPKDNSLNIIYRTEGTSRFTKYTSKKNVAERDSFIIVCSYLE